MKKSLNYIEKRLQYPVEQLAEADLCNIARTSMSSKIIGLHGDHFAQVVVSAVRSVRAETAGVVTYPVSNVGVVKAFGGSY